MPKREAYKHEHQPTLNPKGPKKGANKSLGLNNPQTSKKGVTPWDEQKTIKNWK